jgi:hypothetical protein
MYHTSDFDAVRRLNEETYLRGDEEWKNNSWEYHLGIPIAPEFLTGTDRNGGPAKRNFLALKPDCRTVINGFTKP